MKIELILIGVIGAVFLADFLMKGVKKKTASIELEKVYDKKSEPQKKITVNPIYFLFAFFGSIVIGVLFTYLGYYFNDGGSFIDFINYLDAYINTNSTHDSYGNYLRRDEWKNNILFNLLLNIFITIIVSNFILAYKLGLNSSFFSKVFSYILNRKKNITLFIISSSILKLCIHYFIYTSKWYGVRNDKGLMGGKAFSWHIDNLFVEKINLFIPALIICSLIVWYFNDKIKAR